MTRKLIDINCFAINLVEDHPGYSYIEPIISQGLKGEFKPVVLDVVPFRTHWIMTKQWGFNKLEAQEVIESFVRSNANIEYFGLTRSAIVKAFELAKNLKHDIYDCYYLSGAIASNCNSIITTDTDFEKQCKKLTEIADLRIIYENPVPKNILEDFFKL